MSEATRARDTALEQVEQAAPAAWLALARHTIRDLALTGQPFTSDDIWALIDQPPEPRALGAVIRGLSRDGVIRATGEYRQSTRADCHARPCAIWIGTAEGHCGICRAEGFVADEAAGLTLF